MPMKYKVPHILQPLHEHYIGTVCHMSLDRISASCQVQHESQILEPILFS